MVEFGKKIYPPKRGVQVTETSITGPHWSITLVEDEYVLRYDAGHFAVAMHSVTVAEQEFQDVKSGALSLDQLIDRHHHRAQPS